MISKNTKDEYNRLVRLHTRRNYTKHKELLDPKSLRGKSHHLDHIFSINKGYENNIPPEIIGHLTNLQIIPGSKNVIKNDKCNKSISELYEDIETNKIHDPIYDLSKTKNDESRSFNREELIAINERILLGEDKKTIANELNTTSHTIIRLLKQEGLFSYVYPVDLTDNEILDAIERNENGETLESIGKSYGVNRQRLSRMIKKYKDKL